MSDEKVSVPCCGYAAKSGDYPVRWNELNNAVQCHNCGQVWTPDARPPEQRTEVADSYTTRITEDWESKWMR
jgi:uncharacterized Zn finger protein